MLGSILSGIIKVATLPIDIAESGLDVIAGGDGSKESKEESGITPFSSLRDGVCKGIEDALDGEED